MFPNTITLLNIPRSHNGSDADGETGEESEGKHMDTPPPTVVTVDASRSRGWSENRHGCSSKAVALCAVVEVAESVGGGAVV